MSLNPVLLTVWAVLSACFVGLLIYRGQLTRYEDEQLFLNDDANLQAKDTRTSIVRRIERIQPLVRIVGGAASAVTICAVGIYVWEAWKTIQ